MLLSMTDGRLFSRAIFGSDCLNWRFFFFIVDVGVRRIQLERDELLRAMRAVQRRVSSGKEFRARRNRKNL